MNYLENYYANYDEEGRLASNCGQVEYLTTMKYIHDVIGCSEKKKILEVGAGTGRYSIALAQEGYQVDALEYSSLAIFNALNTVFYVMVGVMLIISIFMLVKPEKAHNFDILLTKKQLILFCFHVNIYLYSSR